MIPIGDDPRRRLVPWVTVALILANVAVFVYELGLSDRQLDRFVQSVGTIPLEILNGVDIPPPAPGPIYITLITAMFVHGGFLHIASNMLYLWVFGDNVEDAFGHLGFLAFYFAAGIIAGHEAEGHATLLERAHGVSARSASTSRPSAISASPIASAPATMISVLKASRSARKIG